MKEANGNNSKRGRIIKVFETYSPLEFLRAKYKGVKPIDKDIKILESLVMDLKLNPAVVNVLIDYALKTNNNKLVKNYVESIAAQWKRSGIETASEAMNIAEKEHKKRFKDSKKTKVEVVPQWFNQELDSKELPEDEEEDFKNFIEEIRK